MSTARIELKHGGHAKMKETLVGVELLVFDADGQMRVIVEAAFPAEDKAARSTDDKKQAVLTLLMDEKWRGRSNNWIAKECRVSNHFVKKVRDEMEESGHPTSMDTAQSRTATAPGKAAV
jgi:hypothetical protein